MTRTYRPEIAYPRDLAQEDEHFHSGINDKGEIRGLLMSGRHLGITASCMRPGMLRELSIGRHGLTRLFVDSGAFSEVKFGPYRVVKEITHDEWQRRFRLYRWASATFRRRAYIVAPDRVGDQDVTLERLQRYALDIAWCASFGANVIVPVQKGALSMGEFFKLASNVLCLRTAPIAGIPMQKDATSIAELREFAATLPWFGARIHLLGIGPKAKLGRFRKAIDAIKAVQPNCEVTSDSALVPSLVGRTNGPGGKPRILTKLQDDARQLGLRGHQTKEYGLKHQGWAENADNIRRAQAQGWRDVELDQEDDVELQLEDHDATVTTYRICI